MTTLSSEQAAAHASDQDRRRHARGVLLRVPEHQPLSQRQPALLVAHHCDQPGARHRSLTRADHSVTRTDHTEGGDPNGPWAHPDQLPEEQAKRAETLRLVRDAIAQLAEDQRTVITLVDLQQMDYEEAARITGASLGSPSRGGHAGRPRLGAFPFLPFNSHWPAPTKS